MLITVPLENLSLSSNNVRKTDVGAAREEMEASLIYHGLQQNLVVVPSIEGGERYAVIAGGRRLAALKTLRDQGRLVPNIGDGWRIPCVVADSANASEISLAENAVRVAMHPADQFEAWAKLAEGGATREEIARRFGVSERLVSQRLRLGTVAPALMQAYRDEKLTLEALTAFAVCDDEARQLGAWEKLRHGHVSPHAVRRLLTEGSVLGDSKIARFVGEEAYCAAGGTVTRDLFGEERYFENAALLESLAMRKLQEKADALKAEGWAHAEASLDANRETMRGYGEALDPDDCSDAQKRDGRVFLWIDHDGRAMAMAYREKTADDSSKPENAALAENARDSAYSATLREELAARRTAMLRAAVGEDFSAAFDLMAYAMATKRFDGCAGYARSPLDIRVENCRTHEALNDSGEKIAAQEKDLVLDWAQEKDPQDRFAAFCALPEGEKRKIFAFCVAGGVVGGLSGDMPPECEAIASRLKVQAHKEWRPNAAFFNRMTKAKLLSLAADIIGEERAAKLADLTRGGIAERLGSVFAGDALATSGMDAERLEYIATWLPDGMAYAEIEDDEASPLEKPEESVADSPSSDHGVACVEITPGQPLPAWLFEDEAA